MTVHLTIQNIFLYISFFSPLRGSINPKGCLKHMDEGWVPFWRFLKIISRLCEIIGKTKDLNFNQSSLIGCFGLNLDSVIALTKHHTARDFLEVDCWLIMGKYYSYMQHLYDGCNSSWQTDSTLSPSLCKTGKYLSLMDIVHSPNIIYCSGMYGTNHNT